MENDDKYLPELLAEKDSLDSSFTHAMKLLNAGKAVLSDHYLSLRNKFINLFREGPLKYSCARPQSPPQTLNVHRFGCHVFADGTHTAPVTATQ